MTDTTNHKPIKILEAPKGIAFFLIAESQLDEIRNLFDSNSIKYTIDEYLVSIDGGPQFATVQLARFSNVPAVQKLLDQTP